MYYLLCWQRWQVCAFSKELALTIYTVLGGLGITKRCENSRQIWELLSSLDRSPFCGGSIRTPVSSSSSAFTTMSSAKRKMVTSRPPMLTLPSWSSKASHMILSRKMLKSVGERKHPCRAPTVVLNHYPVLPLNGTALWALSYRFAMARMMLALMLYFLIVAHKASCHTLSKAFLKSMKTW